MSSSSLSLLISLYCSIFLLRCLQPIIAHQHKIIQNLAPRNDFVKQITENRALLIENNVRNRKGDRFLRSISVMIYNFMHEVPDGTENQNYSEDGELNFWFRWRPTERKFILQSEKNFSWLLCIWYGCLLNFFSYCLVFRSVGRHLNQKFRFNEPSGKPYYSHRSRWAWNSELKYM